jgi:hypothetical protein
LAFCALMHALGGVLHRLGRHVAAEIRFHF